MKGMILNTLNETQVAVLVKRQTNSLSAAYVRKKRAHCHAIVRHEGLINTFFRVKLPRSNAANNEKRIVGFILIKIASFTE